MLSVARKLVHPHLRAIRRARDFPILLPHHRLLPAALESPGQGPRPLPERLLLALRSCDGSQRLAEVARSAAIAKVDLIEEHDRGTILLWRCRLPKAAAPAVTQPRIVILSPHPDDAALSLGGLLLSRAGDAGEVLIVDVFSRASWWRFAGGAEDRESIQAMRDAEEMLAARLSGASLRKLDLPEALLRGHRMEELFTVQPGPADAEVSEAVELAAVTLGQRHPRALFCLPLGVGGHIDHRIVRQRGLAGLRRSGVVESQTCLYEELPYAAEMPTGTDFSRLIPGRRLRHGVEFGFAPGLLRWKLELLRVYWSQFAWSRIAHLGEYACRVGHGRPMERVWRFQDASS